MNPGWVIAFLLLFTHLTGHAESSAPVRADVTRVSPKDALVSGAIQVWRNGRLLAPGEVGGIIPNDLIQVRNGHARLVLRMTDGQEIDIDQRASGTSGYRFRPESRSVFTVLAGMIQLRSAAGTTSAVTRAATRDIDRRCDGGDLQLPADEVRDVSPMLIAGERELHLRWFGGMGPYRVTLSRDGRLEAQMVVAHQCELTLARHDWKPGIYTLVIDSGPCVTNRSTCKGGMRDDHVQFVAPDRLPPSPPRVAEAALAPAERQVLYAEWLAQQEGGAWRMEALQQAHPWANDARVAEWLADWGGGRGR